jgi:phosphoadenosine phosphosulfate reductase
MSVDAEIPTEEYEKLDAEGRLRRALEEYDDIVVASSFGLEDVAILDMVYDEIGARPPVVFLDTLYHFDETLELVERFEEEYDLDLRIYKPEQETRETFEREHGERFWECDADAVEWDEAHGLVKVNPLVDWSREDVWEYVKENDVPYNPLHDEGYPSVGDEPLTEPVGEGDDERAGRWSGSDKTECGLHTESKEDG